jgi:hypothetical protein
MALLLRYVVLPALCRTFASHAVFASLDFTGASLANKPGLPGPG